MEFFFSFPAFQLYCYGIPFVVVTPLVKARDWLAADAITLARAKSNGGYNPWIVNESQGIKINSY